MRYVTLAAVAGTIFYNTVLATGPLTLFARKLAANVEVVGLLAAVIQLAVLIQLPLAREVETKGRKRLILPSYLAAGLLGVPLVVLPWLPVPPWARQAVLVGSVALVALVRQPGLASWMPLVGDVVPEDVRGRFFGRMRTAWQSAALVLALGTAALFGREARWWHFQALFALGVAAGLVRVPLVRRIPEPPPHPSAAARSRASFLGEPLRDRPFIAYVFLVGTVDALLTLTGPFSVVYMRETLGYADGFVMFSTVALPVAGAILTLILWGHLADRIGNRAILVLTTAGTALTLLVWLVVVRGSVAGQWALAGSIFLRGLLQAGFGIASSRYLYGVLPAGNKSGYTAVHTVTCGVLAGLGPLAGGFFLRHTGALTADFLGLPLDNYKVLFGLSAAALVVPVVLLARRHSPGDASTREFLGFLVTRPIRTAMDIALYHRPLDEESRVQVTRRLSQVAGHLTLRELLDGLDDPSYQVRKTAAQGLALYRSAGPAAVNALLARLAEPDALTRPAVIWSLGELEAEAAVGPLIGELPAADRHVRAQAALALAKIGQPQAVKALLDRWQAEEDLYVQACVATALSRLGSADFVPQALRRLTPQTPVVVRRQLATAVGALFPLEGDFYHTLRAEMQSRGTGFPWHPSTPLKGGTSNMEAELREAYLAGRDADVVRLAAASFAPSPFQGDGWGAATPLPGRERAESDFGKKGSGTLTVGSPTPFSGPPDLPRAVLAGLADLAADPSQATHEAALLALAALHAASRRA